MIFYNKLITKRTKVLNSLKFATPDYVVVPSLEQDFCGTQLISNVDKSRVHIIETIDRKWVVLSTAISYRLLRWGKDS